MKRKPPAKVYYSITEIADQTDVKPHVLRYWESEFGCLSPKKNRAGNRVYQEKDIKMVRLIKDLLYDEGYTIAGAKKKLNRKGVLDDATLFAVHDESDLIRSIKGDLEDLLRTLPDR